jgi:hypothetical protein
MNFFRPSSKLKSQSGYFVSAPFARLTNKIFGKPIYEIAESCEVISPGGRFFHPPAVFDPSELVLVSGVHSDSTIKNEISRANGHYVDHGPTIAYKIKNMLLCDGVFYAHRYRNTVSVNGSPLLRIGQAPWVEGGILTQSWLGAKYFAHAIYDEIPMQLLAQKRGRAVGTQRPETSQQYAYREFFGTHYDCLPNTAWIDQMEILDDKHCNPSMVERWNEMRAIYAKRTNTSMHPGVVLLRGNTGIKRVLTNEDEMAEYFLKLGFKVINPGLSSFQAVIEAVAGAKIVVGVEGSQLVHGLFGMASGGAMLIIQPPFRFNNAFKEKCDLLGLTYSFLIAHQISDGFVVHMDQLDRALERIDMSLCRNHSMAQWQ